MFTKEDLEIINHVLHDEYVNPSQKLAVGQKTYVLKTILELTGKDEVRVII